MLALSFLCCAQTPSASATSAGHGVQIGRFLAPESVSGKVKRAVEELTVLGREEGDFLGAQRCEAFTLVESSAQPRQKSIVADVIEVSRRHGRYSLAEFCLEGTDEFGRVLAFDDDNECAAYLIGYHKRPRLEQVTDYPRSSCETDSSEHARMNKALDHMQKHVNTP